MFETNLIKLTGHYKWYDVIGSRAIPCSTLEKYNPVAYPRNCSIGGTRTTYDSLKIGKTVAYRKKCSIGGTRTTDDAWQGPKVEKSGVKIFPIPACSGTKLETSKPFHAAIMHQTWGGPGVLGIARDTRGALEREGNHILFTQWR